MNLKNFVETILRFAKNNKLFVFFLSIAFLMWLSVLFFNEGAFSDERTHYRQINRFLKGHFDTLSNLTVIPGYHVVIAFFAYIVQSSSLITIRLINFLLSIISIPVFYIIAKKINADKPLIRTLQFIFLPVSFFYFPLAYTDIFSLLLVLLTFYFALDNKYKLSALFSLASILVRQNNIIWVAFIWLFIYISTYGFVFSINNIASHFRRTAGHIVVAISFILFVLFNNGIAIGDKNNHQFGFYTGNLYFFLVVLGFLFLPLLIERLYKVGSFKFKRSVIFSIIIGVAVAFSFFLLMPELHQGNGKMSFLRNIILQSAYYDYVGLYMLAIFFGCMAFFLMKLDKTQYLILPFIIASLAPSFLIEQRYYIIPFAFLLLFRKKGEQKTEFTLLIYFLILSLILARMIFNTDLFL